MEMKLAENIRAFRRERSLTQEQLSEVLGVTAGAVYKWEAKLSVPDIELIAQMADFFDVSVDVLLGFEIRDNRLDATVKRLQDCRRRKDCEGLAEAEKALKKYPHAFRIVYECAVTHNVFGIETGKRELFLRALELYEQALLLLPQNEDPEISEQTIYGKMAETYLGLDDADKAIALYKAHNAGGLFSSKIGHILAQQCARTDEAAVFLSEAMARITADVCNTVVGYVNVFGKQKDYDSAEAILQWAISVFSGLRRDGRPNFFDKVSCAFLATLAQIRFESGREDAARESLKSAKALAAFFDAAPSYDESDIRFVNRIEGASAHDDLGATAADAIQSIVDEYENEAFTALWNRIREEEE